MQKGSDTGHFGCKIRAKRCKSYVEANNKFKAFGKAHSSFFSLPLSLGDAEREGGWQNFLNDGNNRSSVKYRGITSLLCHKTIFSRAQLPELAVCGPPETSEE